MSQTLQQFLPALLEIQESPPQPNCALFIGGDFGVCGAGCGVVLYR